jgi:hypothetical protein
MAFEGWVYDSCAPVFCYVRGLFISSYRCFICSGIQSKVISHSGLGSGFLLDALVKSEVFLFVDWFSRYFSCAGSDPHFPLR